MRNGGKICTTQVVSLENMATLPSELSRQNVYIHSIHLTNIFGTCTVPVCFRREKHGRITPSFPPHLASVSFHRDMNRPSGSKPTLATNTKPYCLIVFINNKGDL